MRIQTWIHSPCSTDLELTPEPKSLPLPAYAKKTAAPAPQLEIEDKCTGTLIVICVFQHGSEEDEEEDLAEMEYMLYSKVHYLEYQVRQIYVKGNAELIY